MAKRRTRRAVSRGYYRMTPARRTALRKAQLISARKRKGRGRAVVAHVSRHRGKYTAGVVGLTLVGAAVARHKGSGSELNISINKWDRSSELRRPKVSAFARSTHGQEPYGSRFDSLNPNAPAVMNRNLRAGVGMRGVAGVSATYTHRPLTPRNFKIVRADKATPRVVTGKRIKVNPGVIPMSGYTKSGKLQSAGGFARSNWPHLNKKETKKQLKALREKGFI